MNDIFAEAAKFLLSVTIAYFCIGFGMLYAFCPINDKDTSTIHRVTTLLFFSGVLTIALVKVWS